SSLLTEFRAQLVAHQRPDLLDSVLSCNAATNVCVKVLGTGARTLACDGETVTKNQHAEGQQTKRDALCSEVVVVMPDALHGLTWCITGIQCGEEVLADNVCLDDSRRHAGCCLSHGLDDTLN